MSTEYSIDNAFNGTLLDALRDHKLGGTSRPIARRFTLRNFRVLEKAASTVSIE